ncbi:N-acetyltransferase [Cronobacter muytjensii]|uniref:N-acetyltransferase n=1 Tax=Cronobacter muytjensii TaxID=413501 RepID=UPI0029E31086|nr:N-acetyltransferase [Cronobacter muytjensii]ELY3983477.1 N-acetyltransferase [Cronobacter muytjensii]
MIRAQRPADRERVLALWLASTTAGHPFIRPDYWRASLPVVRDVYLPGACTWVEEENHALRGFISVMHEKFIGALFVAPAWAGKGVGTALLTHVQSQYDTLNLEVYQKNTRAVNFYHARGFRIEESAWQEETRHATWIMRWQADQTP